MATRDGGGRDGREERRGEKRERTSGTRAKCSKKVKRNEREGCREGGGKEGGNIKVRDGESSLVVGTWNVRTMNREGKLENVKKEMDDYGVNVLGLCEVRWKGCGDFESEGFRVIYSGGEECQRGVAVVLDRMTANKVMDIEQISDRMMMVRIQAEPVNMVIVQVYMPTTDHDDEEVEKMYEQLEGVLDKMKGKENVVIMGDWNAVVGEDGEGREVGMFGLGKRNERGEKLTDFCRRNKFVVTNTLFQHHRRRRYTWKKPGDTGRYQIDYILVRQRYRNSVKNSRSYPGADADTDHNLVVMKINVMLKKIIKTSTKRKWDMQRLKTNEAAFSRSVEDSIQGKEGSSVRVGGRI